MRCKDCNYPINYDNFMASVNGCCDECIIKYNICEYCKVFSISSDPGRAEWILCDKCYETINEYA